jgi:hypothetical protein
MRDIQVLCPEPRRTWRLFEKLDGPCSFADIEEIPWMALESLPIHGIAPCPKDEVRSGNRRYSRQARSKSRPWQVPHAGRPQLTLVGLTSGKSLFSAKALPNIP